MPTMRKRNIPMSILVRQLAGEELARADLHEAVAYSGSIWSTLNRNFDAVAAGLRAGEGDGERGVGV